MTLKIRGFTLIELLVVIAIIAILAAILFPVFAKVREKARQTSCLSNEKQIGLAFEQYVEDYDELWPSGDAVTATGEVPGTGWASTVYPYIKSTQLYKCPDDSTGNGPETANGLFPTAVSYGFNSNLAHASDAQLQAPASTVSLFEVQGVTANIPTSYSTDAINGDGVGISTTALTNNTNASFAGNGSVNYGAVYATGDMGGRTGLTNVGQFTNGNALHTGGTNFLLADGHAKWFRGAAVSSGANNNLGTNQPESGTGTGIVAATTDYSGTPGYAATFSLQ